MLSLSGNIFRLICPLRHYNLSQYQRIRVIILRSLLKCQLRVQPVVGCRYSYSGFTLAGWVQHYSGLRAYANATGLANMNRNIWQERQVPGSLYCQS